MIQVVLQRNELANVKAGTKIVEMPNSMKQSDRRKAMATMRGSEKGKTQRSSKAIIK